MNPQELQGFGAILGGLGAILGGFYIVVTRPLLKAQKADTDLLRAEIGLLEERLKTFIRAELEAVEKHLNERIEARIVRG